MHFCPTQYSVAPNMRQVFVLIVPCPKRTLLTLFLSGIYRIRLVWCGCLAYYVKKYIFTQIYISRANLVSFTSKAKFEIMRGSAYIMMNLESHEKMQEDLVILKTGDLLCLYLFKLQRRICWAVLPLSFLSHKHKMLVLLIILVVYVCPNIREKRVLKHKEKKGSMKWIVYLCKLSWRNLVSIAKPSILQLLVSFIDLTLLFT